MHGSMGGERRPATVGYAARRQAPLAYPTNLRRTVRSGHRVEALERAEQRGGPVLRTKRSRRLSAHCSTATMTRSE